MAWREAFASQPIFEICPIYKIADNVDDLLMDPNFMDTDDI
jgi:hypothetical protein